MIKVLPILQNAGIIQAADVAAIESEIEDGTSLAEALESRGVSTSAVLAAESAAYGLPSRALVQPVGHDALSYIPRESAEHYHFVPLGIEDGALAVGVIDPENIEARDALQFISTKIGIPYKIYLISERDFEKVLEEYQNISGEVGEALSELATDESAKELHGEEVLQLKKKESGVESHSASETNIKSDAPVSKIVATIIQYAVEGKASDIHIEPGTEVTKVRFRVDGDLHTSLTLPAAVHQAVVSRIKIMAQLRLDERRKPQDGRFSAEANKGQKVDFRVSTFPTQHGEKVVMRILARGSMKDTLESIGLSPENLAMIREFLKTPYGIILIAGPTGSGKSTTLFSMLSELDRETQNVVSLEDPIEYDIPGVAQSQVRAEIGYTFANGLRSILRQDPDVIMVGEIRDKETAQLAIQAALTGHLVFSTIHTNTASAAISRLVNMGVDPYLIAPTLIAVIGQRLVRQMCPGAGVPFPVTDSIQQMFEKQFADLPEASRKKLPPFKTLYHAQPLPDCPTGLRGRLGAFEILRMDHELERVILGSPVEEDVYAAARKKGMITLQEDAILKALAGVIPFEEVSALGGSFITEEDEAPEPVLVASPKAE